MKLQKTYLFLAGFVAILALPFFFSGPRAIASSIGSAAYSLIENAGSALTQRSILNFTGAGVSCADDAANSRTTCTVSGSGSGTINAGTVNQTAYYSGTTAISGAGPGASGQCWVSNGSGSPPSFQNCPSGSGVLTYSGPSLTFSGTLYFPVGGGALSSATEANVDVGSPAAATISNYYVQLSSAPGTGESIVFTLRKNGSSTSVTCTISGASATSCNDTTHTATFAAGDLMDIQTVTTGSPIIGNTVVMATQYGTGGANARVRSIGAGFDGGGSALTSGATQTTYFTVPFACTINAWNITVDTGTITFDVWKVATGTAIPTSANSITASALPAISTGTALHSTTLTGWTTGVSANDIFGVNINTVSSATKASLVLECDQSA